MKKERISIPPNDEKLWRYLTEGLSGRTSELPSYSSDQIQATRKFDVSFKNGVYIISMSEDK